jgi:hypothetical protein
VLDGVVETVDTRSGDRADVLPGQHVVVTAVGDRPMKVRGAALERADVAATPLTPLRFNLSGNSGESTGLSASGGRGLFTRGGQGGSGTITRHDSDDGEHGKGLMSNGFILILIGSALLLWLLRAIGLVFKLSDLEVSGRGSREFGKKR